MFAGRVGERRGGSADDVVIGDSFRGSCDFTVSAGGGDSLGGRIDSLLAFAGESFDLSALAGGRPLSSCLRCGCVSSRVGFGEEEVRLAFFDLASSSERSSLISPLTGTCSDAEIFSLFRFKSFLSSFGGEAGTESSPPSTAASTSSSAFSLSIGPLTAGCLACCSDSFRSGVAAAPCFIL